MMGLDLIVVPYDDGKRGVRMGAGPDALLDGGFADHLRDAGHSVTVHRVEAEAVDPLDSAMSLAGEIALAARAARSGGRLPVVLAGSCMASVGAFAGVAAPGSGIAWFDAHADLNTPETSPSGFIDGMAAATLLGWCHAAPLQAVSGGRSLAASALLLIGARALDPGEAGAVRAHEIRMLDVETAENAPARGRLLDEFVAPLDEIYLHVDLDVLDPAAVGPANTFAAPGGLSLDVARQVVEGIAARRPIAGITFSAYDPTVDPQRRIPAAVRALTRAALTGTR